MQPDPEDRLGEETAGASFHWWILVVVAALIAAAAYWYFFLREEQAPPPVAAPVVEEIKPFVPAEPEQPPAEDIPVVPAAPPQPRDSLASTESAPPPPPAMTLEESDEVIRERLADEPGSEPFANALQEDNLVDRTAAMVDTLSRGLLIHKTLPIARPARKFMIMGAPGALQMDPAGYARYDAYAQELVDLDVSTIVMLFNEVRPLLEQAYEMLGYRAEDFDNAVIRALDRVIEAPAVTYPPGVEPVGGIYKFSDPALESLTPVEKLLIRMGPDNTELVQAKARELRAALLNNSTL